MNRWHILPALAVLLLGGCESAFVIDSDGIIEIAIRTGGSDADADGYNIIVDGAFYVVSSAGSLTLHLPPGDHRVEVAGLADNCVVDGANPRTITVGRDTGQVRFTVVCSGKFRASVVKRSQGWTTTQAIIESEEGMR